MRLDKNSKNTFEITESISVYVAVVRNVTAMRLRSGNALYRLVVLVGGKSQTHAHMLYVCDFAD